MPQNGDQSKNPIPGPPGGPRGAFKGSDPPKQENCPPHQSFVKKFFFSSWDHLGHKRRFPEIKKNLDPAFF